MFENLDWTAIMAALVLILPVVISLLKRMLPTLDGPVAYWVALAIQALVGVLAWLTDGNFEMVAQGVVAGLATVGVYETAKRTGVAKGSRERGVR